MWNQESYEFVSELFFTALQKCGEVVDEPLEQVIQDLFSQRVWHLLVDTEVIEELGFLASEVLMELFQLVVECIWEFTQWVGFVKTHESKLQLILLYCLNILLGF